MKNSYIRTAGTFLKTLPRFFIFELIYKLFLVAVGAPTIMLLMKLSMKISKVSYISDEHPWVYLKNPSAILVLIIVFFFAAVFTFIELSALTACFSCFAKGKKMSVGGMFKVGAESLVHAIRSGIGGFIRFMAFMPLVQFTLSSSVLMMPLLPVIREVFKVIHVKKAFAIPVYVLLQILLIILLIRYCYSLHFLVLTKRPFRECSGESKKLVRGKKLSHAFSILLWATAMLAAAAIVTFSVSFLILLFIKGFTQPKNALFASLKVMRYAWEIFLAISTFLVSPAIMCSLTGRFFSEVSPDEEITLPEVKRSNLKPMTRSLIMIAVTAVGIGVNFSYIREIYRGNVDMNVGILSRTQITAHRGFSYAAPENTMYAFEAALDSGADYIELDVQLTADEQLVVFHDPKLERVTDGEGRLSKYTYEELQNINIYERFRGKEEFKDAKIPLLSEVLDAVGDDILLNIEIKDIGDTRLTTEKTVALIQEYGLEDTCYITSFSYSALKHVKELDKTIKTGIIANSAATAFVKLKYIDAVSMNYLLVNSPVVNTAHQNGKRVFVWTVDSTENMKKMIAAGVDNIITNRPDEAAKLVYSKKIGARILNILKTIFGN